MALVDEALRTIGFNFAKVQQRAKARKEKKPAKKQRAMAKNTSLFVEGGHSYHSYKMYIGNRCQLSKL